MLASASFGAAPGYGRRSGTGYPGTRPVRLNALDHGLRAHTVVLPRENPEQFHQLCEDLEAEWQPQTRTERLNVEQIAVSQWKLRRMEIGEISLLLRKFGANNQIPLLDRLWQAEARMERSFTRAQRELERLQKSRRNRSNRPQKRNRPTSNVQHPTSHRSPRTSPTPRLRLPRCRNPRGPNRTAVRTLKRNPCSFRTLPIRIAC